MNQAPIRAIVIEDDSSWQQILTEILMDSGLSVEVACNLEEALKMLKAQPHRLALVDLSLAGSDHHNRDGLMVLEAVKRLDPGCQSILLTGYATVELAVNVLTEYGAFSFLRKENFNRSQFRQLISQALASAPQPLSKDLPLSKIVESAASTSKTETSKALAGSVLVVDDDAGWRGILTELITDSGFEVRGCASFGDAMGLLRREKIILAVVDLSLSSETGWTKSVPPVEFEGYQLLESAKTAGISTMVVSGIASVAEIQHAYNEFSVFAYLEKQSFDRGNFKRLLNEAMAASRQSSEIDLLTQREHEVLDLLIKGMSNKEIADNLVITNNTVKRHLKAIFEKLGVHSRSAVISKIKG